MGLMAKAARIVGKAVKNIQTIDIACKRREANRGPSRGALIDGVRRRIESVGVDGFALVTAIVKLAVEIPPAPVVRFCTVIVRFAAVSKSSSVASATVITPVLESMAKRPFALFWGGYR